MKWNALIYIFWLIDQKNKLIGAKFCNLCKLWKRNIKDVMWVHLEISHLT